MPLPSTLWRNLLPKTGPGRLLSPGRHNIQFSSLFLNHEQPLIGSLQRRYASLMNKPEKFGNFDLVRRFKLDFTDVTISKWRSRITGLSVVHLDYEGQQILVGFHANQPEYLSLSTDCKWILRFCHRK